MNVNFEYIRNNAELDQVIKVLSKEKFIYLDLEFDKNHFRYGFNLCLMQIRANDTNYLIDPIDDLTISKTFGVLSNEKITKVVYAFDEDLRLLHHLKCFPKNIHDIATVRRLLNLEHRSLNNVIEELLEKKLPKSEQKSNWCARPLTEKQLKYAAFDVEFLPKVYASIFQDLKQKGRESWFNEEVEALNQLDYSAVNDYVFLNPKEKKNFSILEWRRYEFLVNFREEKAMKLNRPSYKVLTNDVLKNSARNPAQLNKWLEEKRCHPSLRTKKIKRHLIAGLKEVDEQTKKELGDPNASAREAISSIEKQQIRQKRMINEKIKKDKYSILKNYLIEKYGAQLTNYWLSNRIITAVLHGEDLLLPYQKKIIIDACKKLNLDAEKELKISRI